MFSIDDPQISAAELTRSVREDAARRLAEHGGNGGPADADVASAERWALAHRAITIAAQHAVVGEQLPPMGTLQGIKRRVAVPIAKAILRAARLFMPKQTSFNTETIAALRALAEATNLDQRGVEHRLAVAIEKQTRALAALRAELIQHGQTLHDHAAAVTERLDGFERALWSSHQETGARFDTVEQRHADETSRTQFELRAHERELRALASARSGPATTPDDERTDRLLDAFYANFEDRFRGSREEIAARVGVYLPVVRDAGVGTAERPILDLGCGRGEWLEVLRDAGLTAVGVDANVTMVTETRKRGLDVVEGDALAHLRALPDGSRGAVTAFHLIEHLPFGVAIQLVDEIVRVLQPGGVAILETPNPQNVLVGACTFYIDPTHRRPLHPETMRFLAEARGLARVEIRFLHPIDDATDEAGGDGLLARVRAHLFGPQDFAVIGHRP